ncbi:holo-ACP synthase [Streptomyces sp. NPDC057540]|uniref:holo-ACP synthase n=1 Tax=Streptomyces sp. NPDC057540 TaxID=3346160 RepID=UPI0036CBF01F
MLDSGALFTAAERAYVRTRPDPYASLAGLFSAKEACVKALSAMGGAPDHTFPDIEVVHGPAGQPRIRPHGRLAAWARERHLAVELSISHTGGMAGAVVVLLSAAPEERGREGRAAS